MFGLELLVVNFCKGKSDVPLMGKLGKAEDVRPCSDGDRVNF